MTRTQRPMWSVTDGPTPIVKISGEFEMAATFNVEPALDLVLDSRELELVTLDLPAVTFIDSVGLGVVIQFADELDARGIPLRIVPGSPEVQRVVVAVGIADTSPSERGDVATATSSMAARRSCSVTRSSPRRTAEDAHDRR